MSASTAAVTVHCLGAFSLTMRGREIERWRAGKARTLFQYLLVNRGRVVLRDKLYEVLWPEADSRPTSSSLRVAAHGLRQILGASPAAAAAAAPVRILHQDFGYLLEADDLWVDFEDFEKLCAEAEALSTRGDHAGAAALDRKAVEMYTGDFLAGETAPWIEEHREWGRSMVLRPLDRLRADAVRRHDFVAALDWSRRVLEVDPYHEDTYQTLMSVHGRLGERGRVKRWHDLCVQRLRDELEVDPAPDTEQVFALAMSGQLDERRPAACTGPLSGRARTDPVRPPNDRSGRPPSDRSGRPHGRPAVGPRPASRPLATARRAS
jgi:two-component SAPR family response regulator